MGLFGVLDISAAGMDVQQARLGVAASNLANARTTRGPDGQAYQPLTVIVRAASSGPTLVDALPRPLVAEVAQTSRAPRLVFDPGHPDADERGFITLPGIDPIGAMLDLIEISRSYEANLRAFDVTRALLQRTLEIGGRR